MEQYFDSEIRVLACSACGAPLKARLGGGQYECGYCHATNMITPRVERSLAPAAAPAAPRDPAAVHRRLLAQAGRGMTPPESLKGLLTPAGELAEWKVQEALEIWQATRRASAGGADFEAAERLVYLTMVLSNHYAGASDQMRQRAMLESALDALTLPRHQQIVRGYLARSAARVGELDAAEAWLAPCDPRSDDLQMDSAWRLSRAFIDTARGDWRAAIEALGPPEAPVTPEAATLMALLRANAWERSGDMGRAVQQVQALLDSGAGVRIAVAKIIPLYEDWQLCARSYPEASRAYRQVAGERAGARTAGGAGGILFWVGALLVVIALGCLAGAAVAGAVWLMQGKNLMGAVIALGATGVSLLIPGGILLVMGFGFRKAEEDARRIQERGVQAFAEIRSVQRTGMSVNDVPQYQLELTVQRKGEPPVSASTKLLLDFTAAAALQPGATVPVVVDPDDPSKVVLDMG
jgi:hypothetical protein